MLIAPITLMTRNKSEERNFSIGEETFLELTMDTNPTAEKTWPAFSKTALMADLIVCAVPAK